MSFIAMYGVSVIFNYILSNVATLIDTIIDKKYEINNIVAIVVCALYFFLIVWVYRNTTAFYGSGYNDVIYGSDSYTLTGSNVWLSLFQGQNDLRQPLYMLTVAPFMGIAYILGIILNCFYVNVIMMVPFSTVMMWTFEEKIGNGWKKILWYSGKIAFGFSLMIEMLQLLLRLGTIQLSDIFYNTVGGMIGGLMYYGIMKARKRL